MGSFYLLDLTVCLQGVSALAINHSMRENQRETFLEAPEHDFVVRVDPGTTSLRDAGEDTLVFLINAPQVNTLLLLLCALSRHVRALA